MAGLNLANFTFNGKEIEEISQIDLGYSISKEVSSIATIKTGVTCKTQIGFYYPTGDVGRQFACDDTQAWDNTPISTTFNPVAWMFRNNLCMADMTGKALSAGLKSGMPTSDFLGTSTAQQIAKMIIGDLKKAFWRFTFFNDTQESKTNASSGQKHILATYDDNLVNKCHDGVFSYNKGFRGGTTRDTDSSSFCTVRITENDATTKAGQIALTPDNAYSYLCKLVLPTDLSSVAHIVYAQEDRQILCTQTFYNALYQYLMSKGADTGYLYITQEKELKFAGVPVIACPMWDYWINRVYWNGTAVWWMPHRVIFTPKSNIQIAINNETVYDNLDGEYRVVDRKVTWITDGLFDVQIAQPDYFLTAF